MSPRIRWARALSWACRSKPVGPAALQDLKERDCVTVHASCAAVAGQGLLITGASGSGKSALALELMALGARLVADDRVILRAAPHGIVADAPDTIRGMIEARGLGLLRAEPAGPVVLSHVLDLDRSEPNRLPEFREILLLGHSVPLLFRPDTPHLAASLIQLLKAGRVAPDA